ncbi:MAG TPA: substrate-binding domain-containing protein [Mycobacteriales bacterium]|nr:substrate-binding domain-containing protein [Mycobacteriales bacterium]
MSVRKNSVKLGVAAAAAFGLALTAAAPAGAVDGGPSTSPKLGTDIIGAGSDTTQYILDKLATDYDAAHTSGPQLVNYDACVGATGTTATGLGSNPDGSGFPCGADNTGTKVGVARPATVIDPKAPAAAVMPNSSGSGRTLLRTPTDPLFNDVAFARSSGPLNTTDLAAGEIGLPFAVDKIVTATNPSGPAPAALTGLQVLRIYNGTYTNWDQVGGKDAEIHPYLPKAGSGTLNASEAFLAQLDGVTEAPGTDNDPSSHSAAYQTWQGPGVTITDSNWNTGKANVEEHDPSIIAADPDAIEMFSYARAELANTKSQILRIEGGWSEDRELYDVVRGKAIAGATTTPFLYGSDNNVLEGIFSNTGWICTNSTAQADIAALNEWPLSSKLCGVANNNTVDTINPFASNGVGEGASTTTTALYSSGTIHVTVAASDGSVPTGSVQVVIAPPAVAGGTPAAASYSTTATLTNGAATVTVPSTVSGSQVVDVAFLPTNFGALSSAGGHAADGSSYAEFTQTFVAGPTGPSKFSNLAKPVLSGKHKVGSVETSSHGRWAPGATTYSYQWFKGRVKIAGATKPTLKLTKALKGKTIHCTVTAHKSGYANASSSSASVKVTG